jgi:hypothetical protein
MSARSMNPAEFRAALKDAMTRGTEQLTTVEEFRAFYNRATDELIGFIERDTARIVDLRASQLSILESHRAGLDRMDRYRIPLALLAPLLVLASLASVALQVWILFLTPSVSGWINLGVYSVLTAVGIGAAKAGRSGEVYSERLRALFRPRVERCPGAVLSAIARLVFSERTNVAVFQPIVADLQHEVIEALAQGSPWKARIARARNTWAFFCAVVAQAPTFVKLLSGVPLVKALIDLFKPE